MKSRLSALIAASMVALLCQVFAGCETSHSETTKENMLGGTTHQETTTTHNPVTGTTTVEQSKQTTH